VVLRSHSKVRAQYLITKPLHKSQRHIEISDDQYEFSLQVIVNPELTTKILEYGADLEVIEPLHLRKSIRSIASKMLSRYKES
jgi:predicted DNA-binding transcriptional regulator YafY